MWPTIDIIDEHVSLTEKVKELKDLLATLKEEKEDREVKIKDLMKDTTESFAKECKDPVFENVLADFVAHSGHRTINMLRYLIDCTTDLEYDGLGEPLWHSMHDIVLGGYGDEIHKGKDWED